MIEFDFHESEHWTKTRVTTIERFDPDPEQRCENCPSIAEYRLGIDFIDEGKEHGKITLCPACIARYTKDFDENNIFRR